MLTNNKIYIVGYSKGSYDDYEEVNVFCTFDEKIARKWENKFDLLCRKWSTFYKRLERQHKDRRYLYSLRYVKIQDINTSFVKEIEVR